MDTAENWLWLERRSRKRVARHSSGSQANLILRPEELAQGLCRPLMSLGAAGLATIRFVMGLGYSSGVKGLPMLLMVLAVIGCYAASQRVSSA